jgi:6-methylsalicylate decarboxylase
MKPEMQRIDLHHHVIPPDFVAELRCRDIEWTGGAGVPAWSPALAKETMERHGIAATVAAVQPQVFWGDTAAAVRWARHCNELLADVVRADRTHFGGFASVPLPDVAAACREVGHALDVLGLDGVFLPTSCGSQYLGDPDFAELYQELERRSAVVFVHPNTTPPGSDAPKHPLPNALVEFPFDTTRCIASLIYSGTLERYPSIRFIMPHAGGAAPYLVWRLALGEHVPQLRERVPKGVRHYLQSLYYDTALSASAPALAALTEAVPASQIVFGSDAPFVNEQMLRAETSGLETSQFLDAGMRQAIDRDNALRLFPRFARSSLDDRTIFA